MDENTPVLKISNNMLKSPFLKALPIIEAIFDPASASHPDIFLITYQIVSNTFNSLFEPLEEIPLFILEKNSFILSIHFCIKPTTLPTA